MNEPAARPEAPHMTDRTGDHDGGAPFDELATGSEETDDVWAAFGEAEVDGAEDLWKRLSGNGDGSTIEADGVFRAGEERDRTSVAQADGETHIVPKADYCGSCPHLSAPVEMRCTHEGTEIVELVDRERLRVRDCPVVADRSGAPGPE